MIQGINPFIIIIDKYGEVVDTVSAKSVIDDVFSILRHLDSTDAESSPHLALEWKDGYFERVTDYHFNSKVNKNLSELISALLEVGMDEDAHWFYWHNYLSNPPSPQEIRNVISNIDDMDQIMHLIRSSIIATLKKVADDIEKESLKNDN